MDDLAEIKNRFLRELPVTQKNKIHRETIRLQCRRAKRKLACIQSSLPGEALGTESHLPFLSCSGSHENAPPGLTGSTSLTKLQLLIV